MRDWLYSEKSTTSGSLRLARVALAFGVVATAGCARMEVISPEQAGAYPSTYREDVRAFVMEHFKDPYSLRDVQISAPQPVSIGGYGKGYRACLRLNAKNSMGGYIGLTAYELMLANGLVRDTSMGEWGCEGVRYEPWPEMEMLGKK